MKTEILKPDLNGIRRAACLLKQGKLVAIPTETVYGLAANAFDEEAVKSIFKAKGRPQDNPLIVHIADIDDIFSLVTQVPRYFDALTQAFWPGPLTLVLKKSQKVPLTVTAGLDTVAVRMPSHPVMSAIISAAGTPLAAPSANVSGSPSPTCADHVIQDLDGKVHAVVDGGCCDIGLESTVLDLTEDTPCILRPGRITKEQLNKVLGNVEIAKSVVSKAGKDEKARSPGVRHKHYSPKAKVLLIHADTKDYVNFVNSRAGDGVMALCFSHEAHLLKLPYIVLGDSENYTQQAHRLFGALREADALGAKLLFAHSPKPEGVGLAVYNRLLRAAGFEEIFI